MVHLECAGCDDKIDEPRFLECQLPNLCPVRQRPTAQPVTNPAGCDVSGRRKTHLELAFQPLTVSIVLDWILAPVAVGQAVQIPHATGVSDVGWQQDYDVDGVDYFWELAVLSPTPCRGFTGAVRVPACAAEPNPTPVCPGFTIHPTTVGGCDAHCVVGCWRASPCVCRRVRRSVAALRIEPRDSGTGIPTTTLQTLSGHSGDFDLGASVSMQAGNYQLVVDVTDPAGCDDSITEFPVAGCACRQPDSRGVTAVTPEEEPHTFPERRIRTRRCSPGSHGA